jgi:hypothetical protein
VEHTANDALSWTTVTRRIPDDPARTARGDRLPTRLRRQPPHPDHPGSRGVLLPLTVAIRGWATKPQGQRQHSTAAAEQVNPDGEGVRSPTPFPIEQLIMKSRFQSSVLQVGPGADPGSRAAGSASRRYTIYSSVRGSRAPGARVCREGRSQCFRIPAAPLRPLDGGQGWPRPLPPARINAA